MVCSCDLAIIGQFPFDRAIIRRGWPRNVEKDALRTKGLAYTQRNAKEIRPTMRIITIEEHITGTELDNSVRKYILENVPYYGLTLGKELPYYPDFNLYADMGDLRIADMDKHGIDMQVISCPAQSGMLESDEAIPLTKDVNDSMAAAVAEHPDRLAAFASLPWTSPEAAADELERAVNRLGMKGALLAGRPAREAIFLDEPRFAPVLETAEKLKVPIYVHPGIPVPAVQDAYYARLDPVVSARLSLFSWGWHNEAGVQVLRMILAGVFEKYPELQIISGHWGELVPFFLSRLDQALPKKATSLSRTITETFARNVYVTPSGIFTYPQLLFVMQVLGTDRIIHSVDSPLVGNEDAYSFITNAPICNSDKEKIAHGNVEQLLGLS